ncbi:MAG: hypothetical protein CIT03_00485 [Methanobacterium sp.]|nr:MAG: hypothetical protein CIT03_00485 [Methanobacterium sp.]
MTATDSQGGDYTTSSEFVEDSSIISPESESLTADIYEWTLTDSEGKFTFHNRSDKNYMVWVDKESLNENYQIELDPDTKLLINLGPGETKNSKESSVTLKATFTENTIQGRVFQDLNGNGIFDEGDMALSGVKVIDPAQINFLLIVWPTEAGQLVIPLQNLKTRFPEVNIKLRSSTQALENINEIPDLIEWADLIYISNIQTVNGPSGPLPDLLMSLKAQGKLDGKIIAAYPNPYYCLPVTRLTNLAGTQFVNINGTALSDIQIQNIFESMSRAIPPQTPLSVLKNLQLQYPAMADYLKLKEYSTSDTASPQNREEMLVYLLEKAFPSAGYKAAEPVLVKKYGLYRDGNMYYDLEDYLQFIDPEKPTVGIIAWMAITWEKSDTIMLNRLIEEMESRGINAMVLIAQGNPVDGTPTLNGINQYFLDSDKKSRVDGIITISSFSLGGQRAAEVEKIIRDNDILVFRALSMAEDEETWWISDLGMDWVSLTSQVVLPEVQGQILTMAVGAKKTTIDPLSGLQMEWNIPIDERVEMFADRIAAWINLRYTSNADKKVALIYYNYPPGKNNLAGASYLDGLESIMEIIKILNDDGYYMPGQPLNSEELLELMLTQGLNVANWAPGVLEEVSKHTALWDVASYMEWYNQLPELARKEMEEGPFGYIEALFKDTSDLQNPKLQSALKKWHDSLRTTIDDLQIPSATQAKIYVENAYIALKSIMEGQNDWAAFYTAKNNFLNLNVPGLCGWGPAPGNVMTVNRNGTHYFVIPGIFIGNVFVGPQPLRGWEANTDMLYHSQIVPPHHQYLAWYAFLQEEFAADAMIHLGRHGTYEWLPRKESALSGSDYPDICIGNTPSLYIYIMDGVGEVIHAKRRGLAVTISHLTPPLQVTEVYGDLADLKTFIEQYQTASPEQKDLIAILIREKAIEMHLGSIIGNLDLPSDELVEKIEDYIRELENTMMPLGLHIFGREWTQDQVEILAKSMATIPRINIGSNIFISLIQATKNLETPIGTLISHAYAGKTFDQLLVELEAELQRELTGIEKNALLLITNDVQNIKASPSREKEMLLKGLNGEFIPPTTGNDPLRNPASIPTGGNLYGLDPTKLPSYSAWLIGSKMADDALKSYTETPEQLGVVIWATETQNDSGATIAFVLKLMGLEPIYGFGQAVNGVKIIPLEQLGRPRVDVLMTTSGIFRETFPQLGILLDRSSRVALAASYNTLMTSFEQETPENKTKLQNALNSAVESIKAAGMFIPGNDPLDQNFIAQHWLADTKELLKLGLSEDIAGREAISRLFAPSLGNYGTRLPEAVQLSWTWEEREQLGQLYIDSMKYAYREDDWGSDQSLVFTYRLKDVEGLYHSRSTNLYGVLDVDHNFEFLGGFRLAVETVSGRVPLMFILNQRNPSNARVEALSLFMGREMHSRYFNPEWIKGMMNNGYAGANHISENFVSNLWGWNVMSPESVESWMWEETRDIYLNDKYNIGVTEWLSTGRNSFSMISISSTLLTAIHEGYWDADEATTQDIVRQWSQLIHQHGVTCDHHVCGDVAMVNWAMQYMDADIASQFKEQMYKATENVMFAPGGIDPGVTPGTPGTTPGTPGETPAGGSNQGSSSGHSHDVSAEAAQESAESAEAGEEGAKSYEVSTADSPSSSQDNSMIYTLIGIISILALVGAGFYFGPGRRS